MLSTTWYTIRMTTKTVLSWLVTSSQSPENYSLFIKSLVTLAVLFGFDQAIVGDAGNQITNLLVAVGMIISSATGLVGLARKLYLGRWSAN